MGSDTTKKTPYSVMVSSTYKELERHRGAVREAMLGQRLMPIAMEDDAALPDEDLISASLAKVDESDAYVALISYRYGQTPFCNERNPNGLSLTELEFRRAVERKLPICMFIMHEEHLVPRSAVKEERDTEQKFESFVELAKRDRIYSEFKSVEDLKAKAIQSLVKLREALDKRASSLGQSFSPNEEQAQHVAPSAMPVMSIDELRLAYDSTERSRWPCPGASINDLNDDLIKSFVEGSEPDLLQAGLYGERLAVRLGLLSAIKSDGRFLPHNAAILCFCKSPQRYFPQARAAFFVVDRHSENPILERIVGPLSAQITRLINLTSRELSTRVSFDHDGRRVEVDEIPQEVIREAISNAVAHRDYNATGIVQVRVTEEFVEIINPGSFPVGFPWDSFLEAKEGSSSPKDAAIAYYLTIQLRFEGVGLGFSTFRKYIEKNGKQAIESEVGPGPTVKVRIRRPLRSTAQVDTTPSFALSNVPISVPRHFLGRDEDLAAISSALKSSTGRVAITALHGLRGVGKTTLAAAYAEGHRSDYRATWWIRAETESTLRADLVGLGVRLQWVAADEKEEVALKAVLERLRDEGESILLVYDNANNGEELRRYLPRGGAAQVIVTSNAPNWGGVATSVAIGVWPKEVGADYLLARTERDADRTAALALSEALGGLPLAHEQAAAFCERTGISLANYQAKFEAGSVNLLATENDAPVDYHDRMTVAKTFALAIDEAAKLHSAAEMLISYAALLGPEPIPLFLFSEAHKEFSEPLASALAGDGLDRVVAALRAFALVERETIPDERDPAVKTDCIRLHRLVRQIAAARLHGEALEDALRELVDAVAAVYPASVFNDPRTWPRARRLDAAAMALVSGHATPPKGAEKSAGYLLDGLASYRSGPLGAYASARPLLERGLAINEKAFGPYSPNTARSLNSLGALLRTQGDLAGARPLVERALAISEKAVGPDHPDIAASLSNLAYLLQLQGDFASARPLYERALSINENVFGPDHPETAMSLNNLGYLLLSQGDLAGSRPHLERALAINEKVLGPNHPNTAVSLNSLGYLVNAQGELGSARRYFERALAIMEKVLGPDHPDTALSLINLGGVLYVQGDIAGARPFLERALIIHERAFGARHLQTQNSARWTVDALGKLGQAEEAELLRQKYGITNASGA